MVGHIGKTLRWFFGVQALLFAAIAASFGSHLVHILRLSTLQFSAKHLAVPAVVAGGIVVTLMFSIVFGMAWWRLGSGTPTARRWALAASVISLPFFLIGPPARLSSAAGVLGLMVFSRRSNVERTSNKAAKSHRLPGDGTSPIIEWIAGAIMLVAVVVAGGLWNNWASHEGLPTERRFLLGIVLIQIAAFITTAVHEAGHAVAGLALEMKVRHLLLGPFEWSLKAGKWRFRFHPAGFLTSAGAVGAVPVSLEDMRWRFMLFAAGGPLASLWLGVAAMWATFHAKGMPWESSWKLLSYMTTFSLIGFFLNLVPIAQAGQYSDGARIYQLLSRSGWADVYQALAMVGSTLVTPLRPRDWNQEVIDRAALFLRDGQRAFHLHLNSWAHFFDAGKFSEAENALDNAEAVNLRGSLELSPGLMMEMVLMNGLARRHAAARIWWKRLQSQSKLSTESQSTVDYWKARCALLLAEGQLAEATAACNGGTALAQTMPHAGAYDFDLFCFDRLREAIDAATPPPLPVMRVANVMFS